jgi:hypothetical protein
MVRGEGEDCVKEGRVRESQRDDFGSVSVEKVVRDREGRREDADI